MRGENLTVGTDRLFIIGSPPLARGKPHFQTFSRKFLRITPACAGKTCGVITIVMHFRDHPRLRGENSYFFPHIPKSMGSPPLARGKLLQLPTQQELLRITPACAGKTIMSSNASSLIKDHPRLRGENPFKKSFIIASPGSPPLARAKHFVKPDWFGKDRITPACAGKTILCCIIGNGEKDHPRLRGEN